MRAAAVVRRSSTRALSTSAAACQKLHTASQPLRIAAYPGDGIGVDVTTEAFRLIEHVQSAVGGFKVEPTWYDWNSGSYFDTHGVAAPADMIATLRQFDAVFLGAVGWPEKQADHVTLEPLIRMRQAFDLYACVRPARTFPGVPMPLARGQSIDMVVVRENSEGEYVHAGGRHARGQPAEVAVQTAVHTRRGVERAIRFGLELARSPTRRGKLTLITKSNAMVHSMVMWDEACMPLILTLSRTLPLPLPPTLTLTLTLTLTRGASMSCCRAAPRSARWEAEP